MKQCYIWARESLDLRVSVRWRRIIPTQYFPEHPGEAVLADRKAKLFLAIDSQLPHQIREYVVMPDDNSFAHIGSRVPSAYVEIDIPGLLPIGAQFVWKDKESGHPDWELNSYYVSYSDRHGQMEPEIDRAIELARRDPIPWDPKHPERMWPVTDQ